MSTVEEIEKRRADRRATHDTARAAQEAIDLEAIDKLEAEDGTPLHTMTSNSFKPGVPVRIAFRPPSAAEYKRYLDTVGTAQTRNDSKGKRAALEVLAATCLVYPAADARAVLFDAFPGTLVSLAIEAAKVAELRAEDEKNG
jgi:hypothetical protein